MPSADAQTLSGAVVKNLHQRLVNLYAKLHEAALRGMRKSPIPARLFGPPKGTIPDLKSWIEKRGEAPDTNGRVGYEYRMVTSGRRFLCQAPHLIGPKLADYVPDHETVERESFVAEIPRARVVMRTGIVITEDDLVLEESCCWGRESIVSDIEFNSLRRSVKGRRLPGEFMTIISRAWPNYYHWLTECLTRLCVAESTEQLPVLLPRAMTAWHRDSLKLMGVNEDRWRLVDDGCYEVDRLYFPSFPGWLGRMSAGAIQCVSEKITSQVRGDRAKRLYVGREGVTHRRIINELEVLERLKAAGFESVSGHGMDFRKEVETFANASIIIGVHGAGMANVILAPPGTKVVEILDPCHAVPSYYNLSIRLGHSYSYMFADNCSITHRLPVRKGYDDLEIPLDRLEQALESVLS